MSILTENKLTFSQAAREFPGYRGSPFYSPTTIFRWATRGVLMPGAKRLRLEAIRIGARWLTSMEAIQRFIDAQTEAKLPVLSDAVPMPGRSIAKAEAQAAGERVRTRINRLRGSSAESQANGDGAPVKSKRETATTAAAMAS